MGSFDDGACKGSQYDGETRAGLGYVLLVAAGLLFLGALMFLVLSEPSGTLHAVGQNQTAGNASTAAVNYSDQAFQNLPVVIVLAVFFLMVARASWEGRRQ